MRWFILHPLYHYSQVLWAYNASHGTIGHTKSMSKKGRWLSRELRIRAGVGIELMGLVSFPSSVEFMKFCSTDSLEDYVPTILINPWGNSPYALEDSNYQVGFRLPTNISVACTGSITFGISKDVCWNRVTLMKTKNHRILVVVTNARCQSIVNCM